MGATVFLMSFCFFFLCFDRFECLCFIQSAFVHTCVLQPAGDLQHRDDRTIKPGARFAPVVSQKHDKPLSLTDRPTYTDRPTHLLTHRPTDLSTLRPTHPPTYRPTFRPTYRPTFRPSDWGTIQSRRRIICTNVRTRVPPGDETFLVWTTVISQEH